MPKRLKELPHTTVDTFKLLIPKLPEFRRECGNLDDLFQSLPQEKLDGLLIGEWFWAPIYELTFLEHTNLVIHVLGKTSVIQSALQSGNFNRYILQDFDTDDTGAQAEPPVEPADKALLIGLALSLQRSILSVLIYQKSLSALVADVREGHDRALFDAVRIDRSITACPTIASRIAKAELLRDKAFFQRLRNALKGPSAKHWAAYQDLRFSFAVLRELGFDSLSDDQLEYLFVDVLKLYPNSYNARHNLRKQYRASQKIKHPI